MLPYCPPPLRHDAVKRTSMARVSTPCTTTCGKIAQQRLERRRWPLSPGVADLTRWAARAIREVYAGACFSYGGVPVIAARSEREDTARQIGAYDVGDKTTSSMIRKSGGQH